MAYLTVEKSALSAQERAAAGRTLGQLGDPRRGVGIEAQQGLPDILWCEVPAGPFIMGTRKADIPGLAKKLGGEADWYRPEIREDKASVSAFYISRYPVTHSQFEAFVQSGGYRERRYWTEAGWKFIQKADKEVRKGPRHFGAPLNFSNHPIVGVSWYEALAFSKWLNEQFQVSGSKFQVWRGGKLEITTLEAEGWQIRLPTEEEWEKAARGTDGCIYPWGPDPDPNRANYSETGIGSTSAVGCFPLGESPCGALDMSGNVWEWCQTKWRDSYETKADESLDGTDPRVVRGGSWNCNPWDMRCASRNWNDPGDWGDLLGFRVVFSPGPP